MQCDMFIFLPEYICIYNIYEDQTQLNVQI